MLSQRTVSGQSEDSKLSVRGQLVVSQRTVSGQSEDS